MDSGSSAFVKGGFGCLGAFLAVGLIALILGGRVHIHAGGACMLFVIGGVIGLAVLAIYKKGYTEGRAEKPPAEEGDRSEP